ncbi:Methyltransferase pytC [Fulvia fulva]|uniref:Methyltransferase pytC n=1 Tax=Passalora fulva TaxID=5499 RepID=A0A9Q8PAB6_PASFU|nr:Methyltransferase pytC [Fulvia fulva]KAK4621703.1 Methyltransferase pytC [Fulvia fulva]KAK4622417.1 Methyltransferase pytC [Fulvia fulva]UJO18793.1 Methyltransferase pytC [Fulvia fulva]WPV16388.1 Methyltransferase pytC [Fulvia fulva]WPV30910.1 Methyltransferase pytC [Fulvia fulva]
MTSFHQAKNYTMETVHEQRTYHETSSPYPLPNDATEHERLDLQNAAIDTAMHDKPIHSPLASPKKILDVGCGTGFMIKHFAQTYPSVESIIGVDLSPAVGDVPDNVTLIKGDFHALVEQNHPDLQPETFDLVFSRALAYGMTDWPGHIHKAIFLLKPGGYLETHELDFDLFDQDRIPMSPSLSWHSAYINAFAARGADLHAGRKVEHLMQKAGLVDVRVEKCRLLFGPWDGHSEYDVMAAYAPKYLPDAVGVAFEKMAAGLHNAEKVEGVKEAIFEDLGHPMKWLHFPLYVVWGRRKC